MIRDDAERFETAAQPIPMLDDGQLRALLAKAGMTRHEIRDGVPLPHGYVSQANRLRWLMRRRARA